MNNSNLIQIVSNDIHAFMEKNDELFFNERDFQMHLALWLKDSANKYEDVDLEYYIPFETLDKEYKEKWKSEPRLDIVVKKEGKFLPVELKYKTKSVQKKLRRFDEDIDLLSVLKNQGAQDLGMYGFWKDVKRIELVRNRFKKVIGGLAVFLTNDKAYMNVPKEKSNNYLLSISEGVHSKQKHWSKPETTCAKKNPNFEVDKEYEINWHCASAEGVELYYCIVPIN